MIFVRGSVFIFYFFLLRDVARTYVSFSFLSILDTLFMYLWSCDHFVIENLVLFIDDIYMMRLLLQFHLSLHVLFLFSLFAYANDRFYCIEQESLS